MGKSQGAVKIVPVDPDRERIVKEGCEALYEDLKEGFALIAEAEEVGVYVCRDVSFVIVLGFLYSDTRAKSTSRQT